MENTNERPQEEQKEVVQDNQVKIVKVGKKQSRFINFNDLHTVELDNDDWVKIQKKYSFYQGMLLSPEEDGVNEQDIQKKIVDNARKKSENMLLFLSEAIKEWNLVDQNGDIAPVNIDHIRMLEAQDIVKIITEASQLLNKGMSVPKTDASE